MLPAGGGGRGAASIHWLPALLSAFSPLPLRLVAVGFGALVELKTRKEVDEALHAVGTEFGYAYYLKLRQEAVQASEVN